MERVEDDKAAKKSGALKKVPDFAFFGVLHSIMSHILISMSDIINTMSDIIHNSMPDIVFKITENYQIIL